MNYLSSVGPISFQTATELDSQVKELLKTNRGAEAQLSTATSIEKAYLVAEKLILTRALEIAEPKKVEVIFQDSETKETKSYRIKTIIVSNLSGQMNWSLIKLTKKATQIPLPLEIGLPPGIRNKEDFLLLYLKSARGSDEGQFRLGNYYSQVRNCNRALKWQTRAAAQNHSDAKWGLYLLYACSKTELYNKELRDQWLNAYIDDGCAFMRAQEFEKARHIFQKAAHVNSTRAIALLDSVNRKMQLIKKTTTPD